MPDENSSIVSPTFISVGPGRCGTTWLYDVLAAHPDVGLAKIKETEFFNTNYQRGDSWYRALFDEAGGKTAVGEVSNNYYLDEVVAGRIRDFDPDMKIIFHIRDPRSLLGSYHKFGQRRGLSLTGDESDLETPVGMVMGSGYRYREKRGALVESDKPTLLDSVLLSRYIRPFLDAFAPEQIYFFIYEDFRKNPEKTLREICAFIGVDPEFGMESTGKVVNEAILPKSKAMAKFAAGTAFFLRRVGAYGLLARLQHTAWIKRLLFRPAAQLPPSELQLSEKTALTLAEERRKIADLAPGLEEVWSSPAARAEAGAPR